MPSILIKVDFNWNFALNKYSLRAYLQSFPTTYDNDVDVPLFLPAIVGTMPVIISFMCLTTNCVTSIDQSKRENKK
jgi:hypothetical protein